jgi:hypothetical protein
MRRLTPTHFALIAAGLILLLLVGVLAGRGRGNPEQDKLSDEQVASANGGKVAAPGKACGAQATYDELKRELFRKAAALRGRDQATYDRLAAYATLVVDRPRLVEEMGAIGGVRCAGNISLVIPPGVEVVGGRRQLSGDADYTVQPAADGSGPAVVVDGVDSIVVPLATLARTAPRPVPVQIPSPEPRPFDESAVAAPTAPAAPRPAPAAPAPAANPSFDCARARTRGEVAVCRDPSLAALDRAMAADYVAALRQAGPNEERLLRSTRDRFLGYRDRCPDDACIATTYRGRIREIADIAAGRWRP